MYNKMNVLEYQSGKPGRVGFPCGLAAGVLIFTPTNPTILPLPAPVPFMVSCDRRA